ncbi:MAG: ATP-binding protein [Methanomassiliicoccaceae archaeon]|nr:ATP-binding protein [Methanomassiliicoccaceae archaeon]
MFIGREKELGELDRLYHSGTFQFPVIYGRRRVGKTALINEFIKDKEAISFTGLETKSKQNLENFSKAVFEYTNGPGPTPIFKNFQEALEHVFALSKEKRLILVIDEYPYLAKSEKGFASVLQMLIDKHKGSSNLFLILCGSSMSFMEKQVLGYKSPLYGRRTAQFKILPFDFFESRRWFEKFTDTEMAVIYGVVGGTPQYLLQMDDALSVEENIKNAFLNTSSYLFEEPGNMLKQEVREPAAYNAIISAIAGGRTKLSEISDSAGEETSAASVHLKNLISLGIVEKEKPVAAKTKKKTIYTISDNMFRFWYHFVPPNYSIIQNGMADAAYKNISEQLPSFMGAVFEDICRQYLWRLNRRGDMPFIFTEIGRWWGGDPETKSEAEIDILATDNKDSAAFCECKWTNEDVDVHALDKLVRRSGLFRFKKKYFYLFAKNGFTPECVRRADELGNVKLISYEDMLRSM